MNNNMDKATFEDVLRYLMPYYRLAVSSIAKGKKTNIKKLVESKIDFKKLEKEKGKEWISVLKKQLDIFYKTTGQI